MISQPSSFSNKPESMVIQQSDRSQAIQDLIELQDFRDYYLETQLLAVKIFDRYLYLIYEEKIPVKIPNLHILVCTCLLIAAKFEQPKKPDFINMTNAYKELKGIVILKEDLIKMEKRILTQFGFDFNLPNPI